MLNFWAVASRDTKYAEIFLFLYIIFIRQTILPNRISSFFHVFIPACSELTLTSERSVMPDRLFQRGKHSGQTCWLPKQRGKTGYVSVWLFLAFQQQQIVEVTRIPVTEL